MLYVCGTVDPATQQAIVAKLSGASALIVSEAAGFAQAGSMVNVFLDTDGTIGFEANEAAAKAKNINLDSKMIKLGRKVG